MEQTMPLHGLALKPLLLPGQHHTRGDHGSHNCIDTLYKQPFVLTWKELSWKAQQCVQSSSKKLESFGGNKQSELLSQSFEKDSFPRNVSAILPCLAAGLLWEVISGAGWAALTHIYHQQLEFWGEREIAKGNKLKCFMKGGKRKS